MRDTMKTKTVERALTDYEIHLLHMAYKYVRVGFDIKLMVQDLRLYHILLNQYKDNFIRDYGIEQYKRMANVK